VQYREEIILNITVLVVSFWGEKYREELIQNFILFVVSIWGV